MSSTACSAAVPFCPHFTPTLCQNRHPDTLDTNCTAAFKPALPGETTNAITYKQAKTSHLGHIFQQRSFLFDPLPVTQPKPVIGTHYSPLGEGTRRQGSVNHPRDALRTALGSPPAPPAAGQQQLGSELTAEPAVCGDSSKRAGGAEGRAEGSAQSPTRPQGSHARSAHPAGPLRAAPARPHAGSAPPARPRRRRLGHGEPSAGRRSSGERGQVRAPPPPPTAGRRYLAVEGEERLLGGAPRPALLRSRHRQHHVMPHARAKPTEKAAPPARDRGGASR